jgi:hypothetical protein
VVDAIYPVVKVILAVFLDSQILRPFKALDRLEGSGWL